MSLRFISRRGTLLGISIAGIACAGAYGLFALKSDTRGHCVDLQPIARTPCYQKEVNLVLATKGLDAGMSYASKVCTYEDYVRCHFIIHEIGHQAYHDLGYAAAIAYGRLLAQKKEFRYAIDGFVHGVMMALFMHERDARSVSSLSHQACGAYYDVPVGDIEKDPSAAQCFHSLGHAYMYASGNNMRDSLSQCAKLPNTPIALLCDRGVFMEYTQLSIPGYHGYSTSLPESDILSVSMCRKYSGIEEEECSRFVGRAELTIGATVRRAFDQCLKVSTPYRSECVGDVALFALPYRYHGNPGETFAACLSMLPRDYQSVCIRGASAGLVHGTGGQSVSNVCAFAPDEFKPECERGQGVKPVYM